MNSPLSLCLLIVFLLLPINSYAVKSANKSDKPSSLSFFERFELILQKKITKRQYTKLNKNRKNKKQIRKAELKDPVLKWKWYGKFCLLGLVVTVVLGFILILFLLIKYSDGYAGVITFIVARYLAVLLLILAIVCAIIYRIKKNKQKD